MQDKTNIQRTLHRSNFLRAKFKVTISLKDHQDNSAYLEKHFRDKNGIPLSGDIQKIIPRLSLTNK